MLIIPVAIYAGLVINNYMNHERNRKEAVRVWQNPNNPEEVRMAADNYSLENQIFIEDFRFFNPFSRVEPKPYEPVMRLSTQVKLWTPHGPF